jgi:hypothetical protein
LAGTFSPETVFALGAFFTLFVLLPFLLLLNSRASTPVRTPSLFLSASGNFLSQPFSLSLFSEVFS